MTLIRKMNQNEPYDFRDTPERHLASSRLRPITVSLALTARAVRVYDEPARRACLWLANLAANSQRIQLCWQKRGLPDPLGTVGRIAEADLSRHLGLAPIEIYRALTGDEEADLKRFCTAVSEFRTKFESSLPPLVRTQDTATMEAAFAHARADHGISVISGKWRHGKTVEAERQWLKNLDNTVWLRVPSDNTEISFITGLAAALGISTRGGKKPPRLKEQIRGALGIGLIESVLLEEAHYLWPPDVSSAKPLRAEYVRELNDELGVGFDLLTTDQFALSLELTKEHNARWAPGQFFGRVEQFRLRDAHTDAEIRKIAQLHAGKIDETALGALLAFAKSHEGYLGTMVLAAKAARRAANITRGPEVTITAAEVAAETKNQQTEERIVEIARAAKPNRRGRVINVVPLKARAA